MFVLSFLKAYIINFLACIVIPTNKLTCITCKKVGCGETSFLAKVINVLYCDVCYVTVISVAMFVLELGFNSMAVQVWKSVYLPLLAVGYIVGFVMGPMSMRISEVLIKGNKMANE